MKEIIIEEIPVDEGAAFIMVEEIPVDEGAALYVICHICRKSLYEPKLDDFITRIIARSKADEHSSAFTIPHDVSIFKGSGTIHEIYQTGSSDSYFQEQLPS